MNEPSKTFILGLGHQKCGTSWVYSYLSQSPRFCKGIAKEYHVWDALDIPLLKRNIVNKAWIKSSSIQSMRYLMQNESGAYFDYFLKLYTSKQTIAADITPSYSGLAAKRIERINSEFNKRGVRVKGLILIRDPLSRIKSAVRFNMDRRNYSEGIGSADLDFRGALESYYRSEHCFLRTNYGSIIREARQVLPLEDLYVGIYENIFTYSEVQRLSNFLGVDLNIEHVGKKVNKTVGVAEETPIDFSVKDYYSAVYKFCFDNYPVTRQLWTHSCES